MASTEDEKLRAAIARRTNAIKDILEDPDIGSLSRSFQVLDIVNELGEDIMMLARDIMDSRLESMDRDYGRYEDRRRGDDRYESRGRGRDGRDDRGRGSWHDRRR